MSRPTIFQGSDKVLHLTLRQANGDPLNLTGNTEITVCFDGTSGTPVTFLRTGGGVTVIGSDLLGKIDVAIDDTNASLIQTGEKVDFMAYVDFGATRTPIPFFQQIDVVEPPC